MKDNIRQVNHAAEVEDERCPSGVEGLDEILGGGLPSNGFYLIQGDPGSGKTTLALQFLLEGRRRGENVYYVTLAETRRELLQVARSHGWSLEGVPMLEMSAVEKFLRPETQTSVFHPSEVELNEISRLLLEETQKTRPARLVFDSLSEFRLMAETPLRYRRQLLMFKQAFAELNCTVLLLDDRINGSPNSDPNIWSLSHGVIDMEQISPDYGISRRRLRVVKMRAVKFREGYHDYIIATGGVRIFPRLVAAEHRTVFQREAVSSGLKELDELFGGGLDRGTTTLILGPAGSGKSNYLNQKGVVTILIMAQHGLVATLDAPVDLSYLADMVVSLRYFEADGGVSRALAVIKKRSGGHENTIREFALERGRGVRIGPALKDFHGVLGGVPLFRGAAQQILKKSDVSS